MSANTVTLRLASRPGRRGEPALVPAPVAGAIALVALVWLGALAMGFTNALRLLTAAGFLGALVGIRRPVVGVLAVGLVATLDAIARSLVMTGGLLRFNSFNYLLLAMAALALPALLRLRQLDLRLLQLFALLLALQLVASPNRSSGVQHVLTVVAPLGLYVYFARGCGDERVWVWLALISGVTGALGGAVFYLQEPALPELNPNVTAIFWNTSLFAICLGYRHAARSWRLQAALLVLAAANVGWVFLSGSRGNMLIAAVCGLYLLASTARPQALLPALLVATLAGPLALGQFGGHQAYAVHRLTKLFDERLSATGRTSGRTDLALGGWYIFRDHPLGVGTGGFAATWADLDLREGLGDFRVGSEIQAHAGWVKTLAENGLVGVALLAGYLLAFPLMALRRGRPGLPLLGLLVTAAFGLGLLSTEFAGKGLWLLAMGASAQISCAAPGRGAAEGPRRRRA